MEYSDKVIDAVREYLNDDYGVASDILYEMGEDWVRAYSVGEIYADYCCGSLTECINMFLNSDIEDVADYENFYVNDDGDLKSTDDMCYDIEEYLDDDYAITNIIDKVMQGSICSADIENIVRDNTCTWENVKEAYRSAYALYCTTARNRAQNVMGVDTFIELCEYVSLASEVIGYLDESNFCRIDEAKYGVLVEFFGEDANFIDMLASIKQMVKGVITVEKAVEMYVTAKWKV